MAQLTIYLPDALEKKLRREARRTKKSVSAYLTEVAARTLQPSAWPTSFWELCGSWSGEFPDIDDPPPDEVKL
jgi:hypothetical protein